MFQHFLKSKFTEKKLQKDIGQYNVQICVDCLILFYKRFVGGFFFDIDLWGFMESIIELNLSL
jgi:hypothetical protein